MRKQQLIHAMCLGLAIAAAVLGLLFGSEIARYRAMTAALERLETCETDGDCEDAWAMIQAAKGGTR
jgi:hypothetical protein